MDLSRKLEMQTQRLELLTAQQTANEIVLPRPIHTHSARDTIDYADEGDEVWYKCWLLIVLNGNISSLMYKLSSSSSLGSIYLIKEGKKREGKSPTPNYHLGEKRMDEINGEPYPLFPPLMSEIHHLW